MESPTEVPTESPTESPTEVPTTVPRRPLTDRPWFWVYLFASAALGAILLIGPKYHARQQQLERQYRARVAARQTTEVPGVLAATDRADGAARPYISLAPLAVFFGLLVVLCGGYAVRQATRRPSERPA